MRRRAFLASALTGTSSMVAGCGAIDARTDHSDPKVTTEETPRDAEKYLEFHADGTPLATVGVDPSDDPVPDTFMTSISHREDTELRSLTQRFVAVDGDGTPPRLSLQGPFMGDYEPHPSVSLYRHGTAAVVEVHRFGELANETVFLELPVTRWPDSARKLLVETTIELVEPGLIDHTHVLDGDLEFEFQVEPDVGE